MRYIFSYCTFVFFQRKSLSDSLLSVQTLRVPLLYFLQVVQVYISWRNSSAPVPQIQLSDFERRTIDTESKETFKFTLTPETFKVWKDNNMEYVIEPG